MITSLPPGDYYAVAFDDLPADERRDAEMLESFVRDAVRVRVPESGSATATLRRMKYRGIAQ